jgi:hypothetical protein
MLIALEDPPGFVVRTEAQKAAWDNGYRLERGVESGWLHYASTTGASDHGPWLLSLDHSGVVAEIGALPSSPTLGPSLRPLCSLTLRNCTPYLTVFTGSP